MLGENVVYLRLVTFVNKSFLEGRFVSTEHGTDELFCALSKGFGLETTSHTGPRIMKPPRLI